MGVLTRLSKGAFRNCSGLTSIVVNGGNKKYHSNGNCLIETESKTLISGCKNSIIPADGSVTSIGSYAFSGCSGLTSVTIPDSVTSISSFAFFECYGLSSITLPFIGASKTANNGYDQVFGYIFGYTTESSSGGTYQYSKDNTITTPHYYYYIPGNLKEVILSNRVTFIGYSAFRNCSGLTNVTIGNGVTFIGSYAFGYCDKLTSITIPDSVTRISSFAFFECYGLSSITLPFIGASKTANNGYDQVFGYIFGYTTKIYSSNWTYQYTENSGKTSTKYYYLIPRNLKEVILSNRATSIGDRAFINCSGLTSITIPDSVTSIGDRAFINCSGLTSLTIPDSVTSIGDRAFYNCNGLTSVTIPDSVTSIGAYAFNSCNGLKEIHFNGTKAQWNAIKKGSRWNWDTGSYTIYCTDGTIKN